MRYDDICEGVFHARPNRFIAEVYVDGKLEHCHVKNTGRLGELLIPGARVYLRRSQNPERSTAFSLISVHKDDRLVNVDSQAPNKVFLEYMQSGQYLDGITHIKPEVKRGGSRFDFYVECGSRRIFIEVKGVTLERDGMAMFPDAPTRRGVKHLRELVECIKDGYEAHVVFVVKMAGASCFAPNNIVHAAFGEALKDAEAAGVKVTALDCVVTPSELSIRGKILITESVEDELCQRN